ncbi:undecaprenyldiphospho-muramoylpentapeptide beta-N-acetylglucosaminyltransferase [Terriglobus aquaticus]|uniref:UDP-N-acetylglucosamine--N-acetylmuramyl-(pentapeptide) pyrophosphoryl-undecaprenol N-acetylglucosamine transferase n=1 Tax=Terriglobus aquaticus TaxID=940139 RepID=A0ABW9KLC2_9BACT|nr:undecaprenyldiphospho-muramoylpentapeptide beta-N-acetylglucosaminyltransferase [Terriglobus aquaticus]
MRVLIAGGGTGGHVIPALAIGRELRDRHGAEVRYIGTARGIETKLIPEAGFALDLIQVGKLKNVGLLERAKTLTDLPRGILHCLGLLRSFRPAVVVGVGGYASGPAMLAAVLLRIPTVAYEPNAAPGLANRLVGKYVSAACVNFPEAANFFRNAKVTGVPVREAIAAIPDRPSGESLRLLVTAGSNGAKVFNDTLPLIARDLIASIPGLTIVHQTGERALDSTVSAYAKYGLLADEKDEPVTVRPFLTDMPAQLERADLVLARSGSTVAELAAAGRPSLLVPFPQAADDHQTRNAQAMVQAGAAKMLAQRDLTPESLANELRSMLLDPDGLRTMGQRARAASHPGALQAIVQRIVTVAGSR